MFDSPKRLVNTCWQHTYFPIYDIAYVVDEAQVSSTIRRRKVRLDR